MTAWFSDSLRLYSDKLEWMCTCWLSSNNTGSTPSSFLSRMVIHWTGSFEKISFLEYVQYLQSGTYLQLELLPQKYARHHRPWEQSTQDSLLPRYPYIWLFPDKVGRGLCCYISEGSNRIGISVCTANMSRNGLWWEEWLTDYPNDRLSEDCRADRSLCLLPLRGYVDYEKLTPDPTKKVILLRYSSMKWSERPWHTFVLTCS